jgi:hypothetical protein
MFKVVCNSEENIHGFKMRYPNNVVVSILFNNDEHIDEMDDYHTSDTANIAIYLEDGAEETTWLTPLYTGDPEDTDLENLPSSEVTGILEWARQLQI